MPRPPFRRSTRVPLGLGLLLALLASPLVAADSEGSSAQKRPALGATLEDFTLRDLDGEEQGLGALLAKESARGAVIAMNGVGCPISELYARRLTELHARFAPEGIAFLGLNANRQDSVDELRSFRNEFELPFPLLKDHDQRVADLLGAERTTEVFVLDAKRRLVYRGAVDDQYQLGQRSVGLRKDRPEEHWLRDALESLISSKEIAKAETRAAGCVIGRPRAVKNPQGAKLEYHRDVEAIIQRRCQSCHRPDQIGPFTLTSYEDVAGWSGMIREVVEEGRMPPWHAKAPHGHFENDRSLTPEEKSTLLAWIDQGAPKGNAADAPPAPEFPGEWQIGEPDLVVEMKRSFRVPATGTVRYQYFEMETTFEEDRWIQAMEVLPGARDVVHHILVFCIDPARPRAWQRETGGGVKGYFAAMVPGERPALFPERTGKRLPAGARLIFQVHYTTNGTERRDRSKMGFIFAKKPVEREVRTSSVNFTRLRIPAGRSDHQVTAYYAVRKPIELLSFLPHMHLRGAAFVYTAHYPTEVKLSKGPWAGRFGRELVARIRYDSKTDTLTWIGELSDEHHAILEELYPEAEDRSQLAKLKREARSEVLLDVPLYDFGWQNTYRLAKPLRLPKGTLIEGVATYDNSASNAALTKDMWSRRVRWGEQTWEEMMIGYFDHVPAAPLEEKAREVREAE